MPTLSVSRFPTFGAQIADLDEDRVLNDPDLPGEVLSVLDDCGVIVFRGLHLDDDAQGAFGRSLGEIVVNSSEGIPGVSAISVDPTRNRAAEYIRGAINWHMDGATQTTPPNKATILTAHVITEGVDGTEFASTYSAYDELPDAERGRLESLRVLHTTEATQRRLYPDPTPEQEEAWSRLPRVEHPLVWCHRSGRKSLVIGATALGVVGMEDEAGRALLDDLERSTTRPERVYRHMWSVGDTVIWDNQGVVHRALPYDERAPRELHRTVLVGDEHIA